MWYEQGSKTELRLDRPVFAKKYRADDNELYLLIPQKGKDKNGYEIIGYDWFNVYKGEYNSSHCWKTAEEAIDCYSSYEIFNADILNEVK